MEHLKNLTIVDARKTHSRLPHCAKRNVALQLLLGGLQGVALECVPAMRARAVVMRIRTADRSVALQLLQGGLQGVALECILAMRAHAVVMRILTADRSV